MSDIMIKQYKGIEVERGSNPETEKETGLNLKDAVMEKLLEANDIEVPKDLVEDEYTMLVNEMSYRMKYESMATGTFINPMQEGVTERMEEFKEQALKTVKFRILMDQIIKAENLEVSSEELEAEAQAISERQETTIEMVKGFLGEDLDSLKKDLLFNKAIDFVYENAVIK